jgi:group I intron endonuclease
MGYIYKITNTINDMVYVGQTREATIEKRFTNHTKKSSNCRYLKSAINEYGKDKFKISIICICFDEDLDTYEKEYISKFNSLIPSGYNLKYGGQCQSRHSEETKKKISESMHKFYKENSQRNRPQQNKKHSAETKIKISNALKGRLINTDNRNKFKPKYKVIQKDLSGNIISRFDTVSDACTSLNVTKNQISRVCNNNNQTLHGYKLEYECI